MICLAKTRWIPGVGKGQTSSAATLRNRSFGEHERCDRAADDEAVADGAAGSKQAGAGLNSRQRQPVTVGRRMAPRLRILQLGLMPRTGSVDPSVSARVDRALLHLDWRHETDVRELAREMVRADLQVMKDAPIERVF
jgi:hypothetical protein